jgi:hypothetical protein
MEGTVPYLPKMWRRTSILLFEAACGEKEEEKLSFPHNPQLKRYTGESTNRPPYMGGRRYPIKQVISLFFHSFPQSHPVIHSFCGFIHRPGKISLVLPKKGIPQMWHL